MQRSARRQVRLAALALLLNGVMARAQSAATVPASSDVYERLEAVTAYYPVTGLHLGNLPMSRFQLATLLERVEHALGVTSDTVHAAKVRGELALLRRRAGLSPDSGRERLRARFAWRSSVWAGGSGTDSLTPNGLGLMDALSNPFDPWRDEREPRAHGGQSMTFTAAIGLGRHIAFVAEPRLGVWMVGGHATLRTFAHRAYARGVLRNIALQLGADELRWGQSPHGALFLSGNAPAPPSLLLGMDTAVVLPWLLKLAGPVRVTLMLADLGATQRPPHAKLAGWIVSTQPARRFELNVSVLAQTGGEGGPKGRFIERVIDLLPIIDALAPQRADFSFSDKFAGGNLRLRLPELFNMDVYWEMMMNDFDLRRFESTIRDDISHIVGFRLPVSVHREELVLRGELHNTGLRVYEHFQFLSGATYKKRLFGSPLGPNAKGWYLEGRRRTGTGAEWMLSFARELRDPSLYASTSSGPRDSGFVFIRLTDDPDRNRLRTVGSVSLPVSGGVLTGLAGHNLAWRTGQRRRNEWFAAVSHSSRLLQSF